MNKHAISDFDFQEMRVLATEKRGAMKLEAHRKYSFR